MIPKLKISGATIKLVNFWDDSNLKWDLADLYWDEGIYGIYPQLKISSQKSRVKISNITPKLKID